MSKGFAFPKFESGKPLLLQLTAERMNAIIDAIDRNRPIWGDNMTGQQTPGGIILRSRAGGPGGSDGGHPFKVTKGPSSEDDDAKVFIQPGTVLGIIPKIGSTLIDNDPPPSLAFSEDGMVLLRVSVSGFSDTFRPGITDLVLVKKDGTAIEDDDGDPLDELTIIWDDESTRETGYFFIRVAGIKCTTPDPPEPQVPTVTQVNQFLMKNIYSVILVVDEVNIGLDNG